MKKAFLTFFMIIALTLTACTKKQEGDQAIDKLSESTVIMKINGKPYTKKDFDASFNKLYISSPFGRSNVNLSQDKNYKLKMLFTAKAVNDIIIKYFIEEEAQKNNLSVSDQEVTEVYNKVVERMGGEKRLSEHLKLANMDENKFKVSLKSDLLAQKLINKLSKDVKITDQDVKNYYNDHKLDKFNVPETARTSHIFVKADKRIIENDLNKSKPNLTVEEKQAEIEKLMKEKENKANLILKSVLANPDSFCDKAKTDSDDTYSAPHCGDIGYFPKGKMIDAINKVIFESKKTQVGKVYNIPVQSDIGFHILKVTDHKKSGIMSFDAVKDDIKRILEDNKKIEILTEFIKNKQKTANIEYMYPDFDQKKIEEELAKRKNLPSDSVNPKEKESSIEPKQK